jgi:hypothetical protein
MRWQSFNLLEIATNLNPDNPDNARRIRMKQPALVATLILFLACDRILPDENGITQKRDVACFQQKETCAITAGCAEQGKEIYSYHEKLGRSESPEQQLRSSVNCYRVSSLMTLVCGMKLTSSTIILYSS